MAQKQLKHCNCKHRLITRVIDLVLAVVALFLR